MHKHEITSNHTELKNTTRNSPTMIPNTKPANHMISNAKLQQNKSIRTLEPYTNKNTHVPCSHQQRTTALTRRNRENPLSNINVDEQESIEIIQTYVVNENEITTTHHETIIAKTCMFNCKPKNKATHLSKEKAIALHEEHGIGTTMQALRNQRASTPTTHKHHNMCCPKHQPTGPNTTPTKFPNPQENYAQLHTYAKSIHLLKKQTEPISIGGQ